MPVDFESFRIFIREDAKIGIFFQRPGQINQIAIGFRGKGGIGEPWTY
jgi:hypothetical protein